MQSNSVLLSIYPNAKTQCIYHDTVSLKEANNEMAPTWLQCGEDGSGRGRAGAHAIEGGDEDLVAAEGTQVADNEFRGQPIPAEWTNWRRRQRSSLLQSTLGAGALKAAVRLVFIAKPNKLARWHVFIS
jgi:hypothetical protein